MNWKPPFILCATDFSPRASEAASAAASLAQARSVKLRVVHVCDTTAAKAHIAATNDLEAEVLRLHNMTGVSVEPLLLKGRRPSDVLLEYIRTELPVLVVVGSNIKTPLDRWAIGSFSERIAESSPVPTLVVRNAVPFTSWDSAGERLKVLLALDLGSSSDVVLRWAREFQRGGPCDFISCFVNRRFPTAEEVELRLMRPINPPLLQAQLEREIRKKVRDQIGDSSSAVLVRPCFGNPGSVLAEIVRDLKAHLIAVGAHQWRGISRILQGSVSRGLLHESEANVVCVPITAKFDPREAHIPDFNRVLVATDFSEVGNAAVPFACAACCIGGIVKIIHVAPRVARSSEGKAGSLIDLKGQLLSLIPLETSARCQPPEAEVLKNDDVADAIRVEADDFGADLVCISSHGMGASRALHGSVTKALVRKLHRPLLVIRRMEE